MAEIPDAHKTDLQKTWGIRDRKCREAEEKRKLQSSAWALPVGWLYCFSGAWPLRSARETGQLQSDFPNPPFSQDIG
ncbi:hypothetical protein, partial [Mesorhizobium sp. M7A.F.Ca.CA.002.15.2.1]